MPGTRAGDSVVRQCLGRSGGKRGGESLVTAAQAFVAIVGKLVCPCFRRRLECGLQPVTRMATAKSRRARSPAKEGWATITFFPFASSSRPWRLRGRIPHGRSFRRRPIAALLMLPLAVAGCTVHPPGETEERQPRWRRGGPSPRRSSGDRSPTCPSTQRRTTSCSVPLLSNPDLEQKYWAWRSAIEQVPQDGTPATNLALVGRAGHRAGAHRTGRRDARPGERPDGRHRAAAEALDRRPAGMENARAAGLRFRKAQFELRAKVLRAELPITHSRRSWRGLEEANGTLLQTTATVVEARNVADKAGQQVCSRRRTSSTCRATNWPGCAPASRPSGRRLNALLDRPADAPIALPDRMSATAPVSRDDAEVLRLAAGREP